MTSMPTINLLPWRSQMRAQRRKYYLMTCGAAMVLLIAGLMAWHLRLSACEQHLQRAQRELTHSQLDATKQLQEVKLAIQHQQHNETVLAKQQRNQQRLRRVAHLLQDLGQSLPTGAVLRLIEINDHHLQLKIVISTDSLTPVLLTALTRVPEIQQLRLLQMQRVKDTLYYELVLHSQWQQGGMDHVENKHHGDRQLVSPT